MKFELTGERTCGVTESRVKWIEALGAEHQNAMTETDLVFEDVEGRRRRVTLVGSAGNVLAFLGGPVGEVGS